MWRHFENKPQETRGNEDKHTQEETVMKDTGRDGISKHDALFGIMQATPGDLEKQSTKGERSTM